MNRVDSALKPQPRALPGTLVVVCGVLVLIGIGCFVAVLVSEGRRR